MSSVTLENGVVDYPFSEGMSLEGDWNHVPNSNGPAIRAVRNALDISRGPGVADNQVTKLSLERPLTATSGTVITFKVK